MSISVLGIDTSNYTTSLSVCTDGVVTENIKIPLPVKDGSVGLRQSDAVFHHTVNLPKAFGMLKTPPGCISAIGYSDRPRSVEGSYMPCFLCGESTAKILSGMMKVPLYKNSHQEGHIKAAVYSSGMPLFDEFYAYHLSGGTFELLKVRSDGISYTCEITGGSLDVTAGQIIDRTGVMLGEAFPCGAGLEQIALSNTAKITDVKISVKNTYCNLSGLQNKAEKLYKDGACSSYIAAYVFEHIIKTVDKITENAERKQKLPVLFSGGVSSSRILRDYFTKKYGAYFSEPAFSSDNAAGTAILTYQKVKNGT